MQFLSDDELTELKARCQEASTHGFKIGAVEGFLAQLEGEVGDVPVAQRGSPEHLLQLIGMVQEGRETAPAPSMPPPPPKAKPKPTKPVQKPAAAVTPRSAPPPAPEQPKAPEAPPAGDTEPPPPPSTPTVTIGGEDPTVPVSLTDPTVPNTDDPQS